MKKTLTTLAILLGMTFCAMAQNGGGIFQRGTMPDEAYYGDYDNRNGSLILPNLPNQHGSPNDANGPLGSGIAVLVGLGAAYALKKRKED